MLYSLKEHFDMFLATHVPERVWVTVFKYPLYKKNRNKGNFDMECYALGL